MGNSQSDTRTMYSTRSHVPNHLKPIKNKKKDIRQKSANVAKDEEEQKKQEALQKPLPPILNIPAVIVNDTETAEFADELASYAGSGPRGAFHWFKGRRYINHDNDSGLDKNLLPNDQLELDRQRVLSFIIRWAFRGDISAPIESSLRKGLNALNVG
ncbi:hypothetical protein EDC96DRAFT_451477 [Choanephora cucurbitarum]|nr:hypothetical protein EDC96DRAFT_451477 [Choanephora cucurbitarum]